MGNIMNSREVNYLIIEDEDDHLCIEDIGPWNLYLSITNGAEIVVNELAEQLGERRLEYIDTDGHRDQLLVKDGKFAGYAPLPK